MLGFDLPRPRIGQFWQVPVAVTLALRLFVKPPSQIHQATCGRHFFKCILGLLVSVNASLLFAQTVSVTPTTATFMVGFGSSASQTVNLQNAGPAALSYEIFTASRSLLAVYDGNRGSVNSGFRNTTFSNPATAGNSAQFAADDFSLASNAAIASLSVQGFVVSGQPLSSAATALRFSIFPDAGGVPAGNPFNGLASATWTYSTTVSGAGVALAGDRVTLDLASAGESVNLSPGRYWVVVNTLGSFANRWAQFGSAVGDGSFVSINVSIAGAGAWATNNAFSGLSMVVRRAENCGDSWVTATAPTFGSVPAGGAVPVELTVDAAGKPAGVYDTEICFATGSVPQALIRVPVRMTVAASVVEPRAIPSLSLGALATLSLLVGWLGLQNRRKH